MDKHNRQKSPLMEMRGITKEYATGKGLFSRTGAKKVLALNGIDLAIRKTEIFGLVGQSGSGKTTAGRLMVRLEKPTSGEILFKGQGVNRLRANALKRYRSRVQMVFQDPYQSLNPHLSVGQTILEPLQIHQKESGALQREKALETLEVAGLSPAREYFSRYPHQLSGGQRQRVAIARAIVLDPEFVVADEPTSMLDATIAIQLLGLLARIRQTRGMSFLFITHNLAAAKYLCDRIAVINQGHIVEVNTSEKIISSPEHPYTRKLIQVQPGFRY